MKRAKDKRHVPLADLLAWHDRFKDATALAENLGDGALYRGNAVFRAIRDEAAAVGCTYPLDDADGYFAWPLVSLPRLLATKRIPIRRTRSAIALLDATRPGFFTTLHTEMVEHQINAVLHESAHCVAEGVWTKFSPKCERLAPPHRVVLRYGLGEAFANASELAAMAYAESKEERWLLGLNSYWSYLPRVAAAWRSLGDELGYVPTARWLVLCFLTSNLCHGTMPPALRKALLAVAKIPVDAAKRPPMKRELDLFVDEAMNLNLDFRVNTSEVFYASLGLTPDIEVLTDFDFAAAFRADPMLGKVLDRLADILAKNA